MTTDTIAPEFVAVEYETVAFATDRDSGRTIARRTRRWTCPDDYVRWAPVDTAALTFEQVHALLLAGKFRQDRSGNLLGPVQAPYTDAEVFARLERVVTDAQLAALQDDLDRQHQQAQRLGAARHGVLRNCCPDCYSFGISSRGDEAMCGCGWRGKRDKLHRRPEK